MVYSGSGDARRGSRGGESPRREAKPGTIGVKTRLTSDVVTR
jgi:hypothetical protein